MGVRFEKYASVTMAVSSPSWEGTMQSSQRKILAALFRDPVPKTLPWSRIEGRGSRVRFELKGIVATFHRPHPRKEAKPYQVRDARRFLARAGVDQWEP
jgi:hypothetical protein